MKFNLKYNLLKKEMRKKLSFKWLMIEYVIVLVFKMQYVESDSIELLR